MVIAGIVTVLGILAFISFRTLAVSISTPIFHLDGAFQTASGLFRIDAGQAPGRDFYPYLGIAPLYLLFPIFKLAGSTLFSSVFAAKFMCMVLGWGGVSLLFHLVFKPRKILFSLVGGVVAMCITLVIGVVIAVPDLSFIFFPGNSLKPVRASAPYLAVAALYFLIVRFQPGVRRNLGIGLLIGIMLLWSNDFAIPTAGVLGIFLCAFFYRQEKPTWVISTATVALTAVCSWMLLFSLATAGHPLELIQYNFLDVAKDQWWYFGFYSPESRIFEPTQILRVFDKTNYFPSLVLLSIALISARTRKLEHDLIFLIGFIIFAGGCLATVGGHIGDYFAAFMFWGASTTVVGVCKIIYDYAIVKTALSSARLNLLQTWAVAGLALVSLATAGYQGLEYKKRLGAAKADPAQFYVPEFDSYMEAEWKPYIEYVRLNKDKKVIEDYWGIWSSLNRQFSTWPVDSAIHALGRVRATAKAKLAGADVIVSTRYITSDEWQPWSVSQNFWFYEELLANWEPTLKSPSSIVWRRIDKPRSFSSVGCQVGAGAKDFTVGTGEEGFYAVTLNYTTVGSGRHLLMVRNNISYGADAGGYMSIPPGGASATIPVLVTKQDGSTFESKVVGSEKVHLKISSCTAKKIDFKDDDVLKKGVPSAAFAR